MKSIEKLTLGLMLYTLTLGGVLAVRNSQIKHKIVEDALVAMDANKDGVTSIKEQKGNMPNGLYARTTRWDGSEDLTVKTTTRNTGQKVEYKGNSPPWFDVRDCQKYLKTHQ